MRTNQRKLKYGCDVFVRHFRISTEFYLGFPRKAETIEPIGVDWFLFSFSNNGGSEPPPPRVHYQFMLLLTELWSLVFFLGGDMCILYKRRIWYDTDDDDDDDCLLLAAWYYTLYIYYVATKSARHHLCTALILKGANHIHCPYVYLFYTALYLWPVVFIGALFKSSGTIELYSHVRMCEWQIAYWMRRLRIRVWDSVCWKELCSFMWKELDLMRCDSLIVDYLLC